MFTSVAGVPFLHWWRWCCFNVVFLIVVVIFLVVLWKSCVTARKSTRPPSCYFIRIFCPFLLSSPNQCMGGNTTHVLLSSWEKKRIFTPAQCMLLWTSDDRLKQAFYFQNDDTLQTTKTTATLTSNPTHLLSKIYTGSVCITAGRTAQQQLSRQSGDRPSSQLSMVPTQPTGILGIHSFILAMNSFTTEQKAEPKQRVLPNNISAQASNQKWLWRQAVVVCCSAKMRSIGSEWMNSSSVTLQHRCHSAAHGKEKSKSTEWPFSFITEGDDDINWMDFRKLPPTPPIQLPQHTYIHTYVNNEKQDTM